LTCLVSLLSIYIGMFILHLNRSFELFNVHVKGKLKQYLRENPRVSIYMFSQAIVLKVNELSTEFNLNVQNKFDNFKIHLYLEASQSRRPSTGRWTRD
jgi:hypothetical protein